MGVFAPRWIHSTAVLETPGPAEDAQGSSLARGRTCRSRSGRCEWRWCVAML